MFLRTSHVDALPPLAALGPGQKIATPSATVQTLELDLDPGAFTAPLAVQETLLQLLRAPRRAQSVSLETGCRKTIRFANGRACRAPAFGARQIGRRFPAGLPSHQGWTVH